MQRIQDYIDSVESYNINHVPSQPITKAATRGGMKIDPGMILLARQMKDSGMSLRAIGKLLHVSHETIRNMLSKV